MRLGFMRRSPHRLEVSKSPLVPWNSYVVFGEEEKFTIPTLVCRVPSCSGLCLSIHWSTVDLAMSHTMCPTMNSAVQGAIEELVANRVVIVTRSRGH